VSPFLRIWYSPLGWSHKIIYYAMRFTILAFLLSIGSAVVLAAPIDIGTLLYYPYL